MTKRTSVLDLALPPFDPASMNPEYVQLTDGLRAAILGRRLGPGARLPSSRALAASLGVARTTVVRAFEQLRAEGYVNGRVGSGTRVAAALPDDLLRAVPAYRRVGSPVWRGEQRAPAADSHSVPAARLSARGRLLDPPAARSAGAWADGAGDAVPAFRPDTPALDDFPVALWARVAGRRLRRLSGAALAPGDPRGYAPLRAEIAAYLGAARGVRCTPDQIVVVAGSQQGLDLVARCCLDPGDRAWMEDPGYPGARDALAAAGAELVPVPVDADGLDVAAGERLAPDARLAFVTPAHQAPLGVALSVARRLALLDWARRADAWVLEDDYDSEYRYAGRPLPALQGLDADGRVLYLGTFSKTLFPALRLGYLVVPDAFVDTFAAVRRAIDRHPPLLEQAIVADFMAAGHFARHVRRMRALYAERQAALVEAARVALAGVLNVEPRDAGLQLIGWLPAGADDHAAWRAAHRAGVESMPLSSYRLRAAQRPGLLLGYAGVPAVRMSRAAQALSRALQRMQRDADRDTAPDDALQTLAKQRHGRRSR